jgi:hypothetical protein
MRDRTTLRSPDTSQATGRPGYGFGHVDLSYGYGGVIFLQAMLCHFKAASAHRDRLRLQFGRPARCGLRARNNESRFERRQRLTLLYNRDLTSSRRRILSATLPMVAFCVS